MQRAAILKLYELMELTNLTNRRKGCVTKVKLNKVFQVNKVFNFTTTRRYT